MPGPERAASSSVARPISAAVGMTPERRGEEDRRPGSACASSSAIAIGMNGTSRYGQPWPVSRKAPGVAGAASRSPGYCPSSGAHCCALAMSEPAAWTQASYFGCDDVEPAPEWRRCRPAPGPGRGPAGAPRSGRRSAWGWPARRSPGARARRSPGRGRSCPSRVCSRRRAASGHVEGHVDADPPQRVVALARPHVEVRGLHGLLDLRARRGVEARRHRLARRGSRAEVAGLGEQAVDVGELGPTSTACWPRPAASARPPRRGSRSRRASTPRRGRRSRSPSRRRTSTCGPARPTTRCAASGST